MILLKKLKKSFVNKTKRESLTYKFYVSTKYRIGKLINIRNYIGIGKKLEKKITSREKGNVKIQLGAGSGKFGEGNFHKINNYIASDIFGDLPIDVSKKFPLKNQCINTIFSSSLIEHLHQFEIDKFMSECFRVLEKNGVLITATPSLEKISNLLYGPGANEEDKLYYLNSHQKSLLGRKPTPARIINCMAHINYGHKFLLDYDTYEDLSLQAGFSKVEKLEIEDIKDIDLRESLINRGKKYWLHTEVWMSTKQ